MTIANESDLRANEIAHPASVLPAHGSRSRRVLMLTRYGRLGASSRQRFLQFKGPLERRGFVIEQHNLLTDDYLWRLYENRPIKRAEIVGRYVNRIAALLRAGSSDVIWVEKEALPWIPGGIERLLIGHRTLVVDFDDGWQLKYNGPEAHWHLSVMGRKLEGLARRADTVLVANHELMRWARKAGAARIIHVPTVVDVERYRMIDEPETPFTIGWIGTPLTLRYLQTIVYPLRRLAQQGARLLLIGAPGEFRLPGVDVEVVPWSEATEAGQLGRCHVGIMPLGDSSWERFKSGYKLIQYMAAGRAVVASPIGFNLEIVRDGETGFFAATEQEWFDALATLRDDPGLRRRFGLAGRRRCATHFSLDVALLQIVAALTGRRSAARSQNYVRPAAAEPATPTKRGLLL